MNVISEIAMAWLKDNEDGKTHNLGMSWYCIGFMHGITRHSDHNSMDFRYLLSDLDAKKTSIEDNNPEWKVWED